MRSICFVVLMASFVVGGKVGKNGKCEDQYVQCRFWAQAADYCSSEYYRDYMSLMCPRSCKFCTDDEQEQPANLSDEDSGSVPSEDGDQTNGLNESDLEDISQKITDKMPAPAKISLEKLQRTTALDNSEEDDVTSGSASQHEDEANDNASHADDKRVDDGQESAALKAESRDSVVDDVTPKLVTHSGSSGSGELMDLLSGSGINEKENNGSREDDDDVNDDDDDDDDDDDEDDEDDEGRKLSKRSTISTSDTLRTLTSLVNRELGASTSGDDEARDLEMLEDPDDSEADTDTEVESDPVPASGSDEATDEGNEGTRQRSQIAHPDVTSGLDSDDTSGEVVSGSGDSTDSSLTIVSPAVQLSSPVSSGSGGGGLSSDDAAVTSADGTTSAGHATHKAEDDISSTPPKSEDNGVSRGIHVASNDAMSGSGASSSGYQEEATSRSHVTDHDVMSGSGVVSSGAEVQDDQEDDSHDIEDAIFDKGLPLNTSVQASGAKNAAETSLHKKQSFVTAKYRDTLNLIEKMMKLGKLRAFHVSHKHVRPSARDKVPHKIGDEVQSDLGKGVQVSFVLKQDFQDDYSNNESAAYDILAQNLKDEVENAVGDNAVVSHIRFTEVRNPDKSPQFSKVRASFKLLGDARKLKQAVHHGSVNDLVVQQDSFKKVQTNEL